MNIQDDYLKMIAPFREVQNYKGQAEALAVEIFKNLPADKMPAFWETLRSVCKDRKSVYHFFQENEDVLRTGAKPIKDTHLRHLLLLAPAFATPEQQARLLSLEFWDYLQKQRGIITRNFRLQVSIQGAFDVFSKYLASIYYLVRVPTTWYDVQTFQASDRQEVAITIMFVYFTKLRLSVSHFKKDILLVMREAKKVPKKILYFLDFLGVEVKVNHRDYNLDRLYAYDEMDLPTLHGQLAVPLNTYLTTELEKEDYQLVLREMHKAVLEHDLTIAIQHYKAHNNLHNRADISFALRGGAGIVRLEIQSWVNRLLMGNFNGLEIFMLFTSLIGIVVWLMPANASWTISGILAYIGIVRIFVVGNIGIGGQINEEERMNEKVQDLTKLRELYREQYTIRVAEAKAEHTYITLHQPIWEELYARLHTKLCEETRTLKAMNPVGMQKIFNRAELTLQNIVSKGAREEAEDIFNAVCYVLECEYVYACEHFNAFISILSQYRYEVLYYDHFLGVQSTVPVSFNIYDSFYLDGQGYMTYARLPKEPVKRIERPQPTGEFATQLQNWMEEKLAYLKPYKEELTRVREYIEFVEQNAQIVHLRPAPLLLEDHACILFV